MNVPTGWKLVPEQMTDAMRDAGNVFTLNRCTLVQAYAAMLAATPAAVVQAAPSEWISVAERLPKVGDYSVLAFWSMNGGFDMIHVEQYFADITNGVDDTGKQLYTKWYLQMGVTHWMPLPKAPA